MTSDSYHTLAGPAEAIYKEKSSKFLAYAYPVESEEEIRTLLDALRKKYYDATHHCYAWRLGPHGETFRANDDGEPSGTAGKPILGQLLSNELVNCLIVVVRYFGGTKLGVSGLIGALQGVGGRSDPSGRNRGADGRYRRGGGVFVPGDERRDARGQGRTAPGADAAVRQPPAG